MIYWQHIALAQNEIHRKSLGKKKNKNNKHHTNLK